MLISSLSLTLKKMNIKTHYMLKNHMMRMQVMIMLVTFIPQLHPVILRWLPKLKEQSIPSDLKVLPHNGSMTETLKMPKVMLLLVQQVLAHMLSTSSLQESKLKVPNKVSMSMVMAVTELSQ